jgi:predicted nucleic acid-binding protein
MVVPALWRYESLNAIGTAVRRGRATEREGKRFMTALQRIPMHVVGADPPMQAAILAVAFQHGLSAYDAAYVALAEEQGIDLISADQDILRLRSILPWIHTVEEYLATVRG